MRDTNQNDRYSRQDSRKLDEAVEARERLFMLFLGLGFVFGHAAELGPQNRNGDAVCIIWECLRKAVGDKPCFSLAAARKLCLKTLKWRGQQGVHKG